MSSLNKGLIIIAAILILTGGYVFFKNVVFKSSHSLVNNKGGKVNLKIFYIDDGGKPVYEEKELNGGASLLDVIKTAVEETAVKPAKNNISNALPAGAKLRSVYLDDHKCVYLDFEKSLITLHSGGTQGEENTLNCLKKTLTSNFNDIEFMKLLVDGKEIPTLAGHLNTGGKLNIK